jgi:hypothetical protein
MSPCAAGQLQTVTVIHLGSESMPRSIRSSSRSRELRPHILRPVAGEGRQGCEAAVAALDAVRAELEARGAPVKDGHWGFRLLVVEDLDGNQLFFNYSNEP